MNGRQKEKMWAGTKVFISPFCQELLPSHRRATEADFCWVRDLLLQF